MYSNKLKNINILKNGIISDRLINYTLYMGFENLIEIIHYNIINNYLKEKEKHPLFKNIEKSAEILMKKAFDVNDIFDIPFDEITKVYNIYTTPKDGTFINNIITYYNYKNTNELIKEHPFFIKSTDPNIIIYIDDYLIEQNLEKKDIESQKQIEKYKEEIKNILSQIDLNNLKTLDINHLKTQTKNPITHTLKGLDLPVMIQDSRLKKELLDYLAHKEYLYHSVQEIESKTFTRNIYKELLKNNIENIKYALDKKHYTLAQIKKQLENNHINQMANNLLNKDLYYLPEAFKDYKNIDKNKYIFYQIY